MCGASRFHALARELQTRFTGSTVSRNRHPMSKRGAPAIPNPKRPGTVPAAIAASPYTAIQQASRSHAGGDRAAAEALCHTILRSEPQHAGALSLLGIIMAQSGRAEMAVELLGRAAGLLPNDASAHNNHGNALRDVGRHLSALSCYDRALAILPSYPEAHYNRGVTLLDLRRFDDALESFDRTLALRPNHASAWNNRGTTLRQLRRLEEAAESYARAIALRPDHVEALNNRGVVLQELERYDLAVESYDRAIAVMPGHAEALNNRGAALKELERFDEALASLDRSLAIKPDYAEALNNRGVVLQELERLEEALGSFDRALAIAPSYAEAHSNRGRALIALKRFDEALAAFDRAIAISPRFPLAYRNRGAALYELKRHREALASFEQSLALESHADTLRSEGAVLEELGTFEEAVASYERARAIEPDAAFLIGTERHARMKTCDWSGLDADLARIASGIGEGERVISPFTSLALLDSPRLQLQAAEIWTRSQCSPRRRLPPIGIHQPHERIRVGYFSADFRNHAVAALTAELFELHDRSRFDLTGFSLGPDTRDELRLRIEPAFDRFLSAGKLCDHEVAALARRLEIDIAVDLGGYTRDTRSRIFALRAAPVQVSYLGYLGTMGADFMDYLIGDPILVPPEQRAHYAEKIAYLPSYQVNDSKRPVADKRFTRVELGLPETGFVFCSFNASFKITPDCFASWMRILSAVPDSVLLLFASNDATQRNLRSEAQLRGVEPQRIVFGGKLPVGEYLARYRATDLFLDTWPYNAGTTASDALWAGLPVLTRIGNSFAARVAASVLTSAGLPELIAHDGPDYERLAVDLAGDPQRLAAIRQRVALARSGSPLFDTRLFARTLESLYERMYARHHAGFPPEHLEILHA